VSTSLDKLPTGMRFIGLFGLVCAIAVPGCAPRHGTTFIGPLPPKGARFKVLHSPDVGLRGGSSRAGEEYEYQGDFGKFKLETRGAGLKIDGRDYGELQSGADVVIDARRDEIKVTVNGMKRTPVEKARD